MESGQTLQQSTFPPAPPQPVVPPTPVIVPQPKPSKFPIILLSILSLLSLSGLAYFYLQTQSLKQQLTTQSLPAPTTTMQPSPTSTSSADPTTNWKTYSNTGYGFSFKYPPSASLIKDDINNREIIFNTFVIYIDQSTSSIIDYVSLLRDKNSVAPIYDNKRNSAEWIGSFKNAPAHYVSIKNQQNMFSVLISPIDDVTTFNEDNSNLLLQILSTFQFTDSQ